MPTFKDLNLLPEIQQALDKLGFTQPTEIQKKAIPLLNSSSKINFHGQAQTGTGKTLAFGIPLLQRIDKNKKSPQALIVAPTRELAVQIYDSINKIARDLGISLTVIYGGVSMEEQMRTLKRGVQIVVGTPGRLNDHLRRKTLNPDGIKTLVLDEADIMLDMGFKEEVDEILSFLPQASREIWLFSATVKSGINDIIKKHMQETVSVKVSPQQVGSSQTKQFYCIVPFKHRLHAVTRFIQSAPDFYGFIFCQTKILTSDVAEQLIKRGYSVGALHGDMSQAQRNLVIKKFRNKELTILVATDVAARGIDVADLTHVINYSIPEDLEGYVHRVGRTGRAGKEGIAITFISKSDMRSIHTIERQFGIKINPIDIPSAQDLIETRITEAKNYINQLTQVIPAIDKPFEAIVNNLSQEDLTKLSVNLLHFKFLNNLDLEDIPFTHVDSQDQIQEISIDKGSEDGIEREDVTNYLLETNAVIHDQIKSIRVLKKRTFVKLASDCTPNLLIALRDKPLKQRRVRVSLTCLISDSSGFGGGFGGPRRGGDRSGDRSGGFRRSGRSGGFRRGDSRGDSRGDRRPRR